jgi:uncharacterized protein (DUF302 family)/uncharacterized membrane protein YidH (DUF202 family)
MTDTPQEFTQRASLSDYLAAERTMLAWIRTGLALMGFGFVVARFGLFLQQLQFVQNPSAGASPGFSLWFGTTLIASGVIVNISSGLHYARLVRDLDRGDARHSHLATLAVGVAIFLAIVGIGMAIYLISVQKPSHANTKNRQEEFMAITKESEIVDIRSHHSVDETVKRLEDLLNSKGITLFALIDHSGEAAKVGMVMRPTKLLIFGSPKAGTPVMLAAPTSAIDLPLKILVWEKGDGEILVSYNSPEHLERRHGIPHELVPNIAAVRILAEKIAE